MPSSETTGLDSQFHVRVPSDFMPLVHMAARRQGLTASTFIRSILYRELDRLGVSHMAPAE